MTASVPLAAVQITNADLLKIEENKTGWGTPDISKMTPLSLIINTSKHDTDICLLAESSLCRWGVRQSSSVLANTESRADVAQLLWHYCAAQMQGFSIFLTAWQTHSNP